MNVEIGSTLINGFALNKALSTMYNDLRDRIEINDVASKYVFADISDIIPEFNVMKTYPIDCFKTFINTPEVNIKNITICLAIPYTINNLKNRPTIQTPNNRLPVLIFLMGGHRTRQR